jgi:hypothetical protein
MDVFIKNDEIWDWILFIGMIYSDWVSWDCSLCFRDSQAKVYHSILWPLRNSDLSISDELSNRKILSCYHDMMNKDHKYSRNDCIEMISANRRWISQHEHLFLQCKKNSASQNDFVKILTSFTRKITINETVIKSSTQVSGCTTLSGQTWILSAISLLAPVCFFDCQSLTLITLKSNSKLQQIDEFAFTESYLTTIQIHASIEMLCKSCFSKS